MKPVNHNNLGVILTFGIPTTVVLLGLLWWLKRSKDEDDDSAAGTARDKSTIDDSSEKKKDLNSPAQQLFTIGKADLNERVLNDGGDAATQRKEGVMVEKKSLSSIPDSQKEPQQLITQSDEVHTRSELQSDLLALNSIRPELNSTSTNSSDSALQSDQCQSPEVENMVAAKSSVTSSAVHSVTSSKGSTTKSHDSMEASLLSACSLPSQESVQDSSGDRSMQPSSQCSLLSDSSTSGKAPEENLDVSSGVCFSQAHPSGDSSSSDSIAVVGQSGSGHLLGGEQSDLTKQEYPAVPDTVSENVSVNCQAPLFSSVPSFTSRDTSLSEDPQMPRSDKESDHICKPPAGNDNKGDNETVDESSFQSFNKLEQPFDKSQTSGQEQSTLNLTSDTQCIEAVQSELSCESPLTESLSADYPGFDATGSEQSLPRTETKVTENHEVNDEAAKDSYQNESRSNIKEPVNTVSMETGSESPEKTVVSVVNQSSDLKQESEEISSAVISPTATVDSNANCCTSAMLTETTKSDIGNVSGLGKKDSKNTSPSVSPKQKSSSSPSKSPQPHSKSSSPASKPKSSSSKPVSSSASSLSTTDSCDRSRQTSSAVRDATSDCDAGKSSSGISENGRADSGSPVCDTNSEASNDSGRGGSVGDTLIPLPAGELVRYEFNFPSELCGRLIGRGGKNIQYIKDRSGASVALTSNPFTPEFQICRVQGMQVEVDRALMLIRKKFPLSQFPRLDMASLTPAAPAPVVLPEVMQLSLPEGVSIDVVVSTVVNAGHIFIQQPTHPTFPSLERLNHVMNVCYGDLNVPSLPRPVEGGIICASESDGQWFRAQVVEVCPVEDECHIKYVDYGGYSKVPISSLKQIRSDFMTLPFQAVECYLANITPLQEEEYFSEQAGEVLMELTSGQMLQGQVVGRGEDSVGYVHLYRVSGHKVLMINREMVNREVVRWIEIL